MSNNTNTIQDRNPNFRDKDGKLYLVRCYNCDPESGKENYSLAVSSGFCNWCGWGSTKCNLDSYTKCKDFRQELPWFDACVHGNSRQFCSACRYVPLSNPFDLNNKEILRLREENEKLEQENKFLRGSCIRSTSDIDDYIAAKRKIVYLENRIESLLSRK